MAITCKSYAPSATKTCINYRQGGRCNLGDRVCTEWALRFGGFVNRCVSHSRIERYASCPRSFYDKYVNRRAGGQKRSPFLAHGKLIHWALEHAARHAMENGLPGMSYGVAAEFFNVAWADSWLSGEDMYEGGLRQIKYATSEFRFAKILSVEDRFSYLTPHGREVIGYIDLITEDEDGKILVTDWKTGALPLPWEADSTMQLTLYYGAAKQRWPDRDIGLELFYPRHQVRIETDRTDEQVWDALNYIDAMAKRSEDDTEYEATPCQWCTYCGSRDSCLPYQAEASKEEEPGNTLDEIAGEFVRLERRASVTKTRLRQIEKRIMEELKDVEEVKAGGYKWSIWPIESTRYYVGDVVDCLGNNGVSDCNKLMVDKDSLNRFLNGLDPVKKEVIKAEMPGKKRVYKRLRRR